MSTRVQVHAVLFPRQKIQQLEIAPLSSMYWHGRGRGVRAGDWHPQQHDSSDLIMANGDCEWITRPLNNPLYTQVTRYKLDTPQGFGLFQQDRRFSNYEGILTQYQKRPSVWIQPENDWGSGQVELVESFPPTIAIWIISSAFGYPLIHPSRESLFQCVTN